MKVKVDVKADACSAHVRVVIDAEWAAYGNRLPLVGVVEKAMLEGRKTAVAVIEKTQAES